MDLLMFAMSSKRRRSFIPSFLMVSQASRYQGRVPKVQATGSLVLLRGEATKRWAKRVLLISLKHVGHMSNEGQPGRVNQSFSPTTGMFRGQSGRSPMELWSMAFAWQR